MFKHYNRLKLFMLSVTILVSAISFAQNGTRTVSGTVLDSSGVPIPGVTVMVEGLYRGVMTDEEGGYSIKVDSGDKLIFSCLGYNEITVTVTDQSTINVTLVDQSDELEGVTVVAFGQQRKESVIGSITTIRPAELKVSSSNLTTALAGRVAGLIAFQSTGEPGADDASFFVRGVTTFGYAQGPLILIDGIEMSTTELARLQVDDIASFSLMKDATATALYGARGANGVILVNTKEGAEGKASVSLRVESSLSMPTQNVELVNGADYMRYYNEAVRTRHPDSPDKYSWETIHKTETGYNPLLYPNNDWYSILMKNHTWNQRYNLNVSGGGKVARYYVAATMNQDNGLLKVDPLNSFNNNIDYKTYTLRSNVNINLTKTTELSIKMNCTWSNYTGPLESGSEVYRQALSTSPVDFCPYYPKNAANAQTTHILFGNAGTVGDYNNPYANLMKGYQETTNAMFATQFELKQKFDFWIKGLSLSAMYNTTRNSAFTVSRAYNPFYYSIHNYDERTGDYDLDKYNEDGYEYLNYSVGNKTVTTEDYFQGIINYNNTFGRHGVGALLVGTARSQVLSNAGTLEASLPYRNAGLAGRITYSFDDRYFIEGNFGLNGSERFSKEHRWGFFPSVGLAWYISREPFWTNGSINNWWTRLKLRATYGLVGNDNIGADRFYYFSAVTMNNSSYSTLFGSEFGNRINGYHITRFANDDITWETARKTNINIEAEFFHAINLSVDLYHEYRTNILLTRSYVPNALGFDVIPQSNTGEASSRGIDIQMDGNKQFGNGLYITLRGNLTYAKNRYEVLDEAIYKDAPWTSRVGYPINQIFGYVAERLFVDDEEVANSPSQTSFSGQNTPVMGGDIKYKDINKDGIIDTRDRVPIGYPTVPEITYGFGVSAGYMGFDLSFFFQGVAHRSFWLDVGTAGTLPFVGYSSGGRIRSNQLMKAYADDHWSEQDQNLYALWPRLSTSVEVNNVQTSTWFMRNGAFCRLKSLEFGYSLPSNVIERIKLSKLRFYVTGNNLFAISRFKLWDPEMAGNGLGYPIQRVFNFGVNVGF